MIINDDSSVISKWHLPLIDDTRVVIYNRNMFIKQATVGLKSLVDHQQSVKNCRQLLSRLYVPYAQRLLPMIDRLGPTLLA